MNMVPAVLAAGVLALVPLAGPAQTRPDFSGRWTTDPAPAPAAQAPAQQGRGARGGGRGRAGGGGGRGDMGSGWGPTITISQNPATLTVEYVFFARGDLQPPMKFVYGIGGAETSNSVMMGRGIQQQRSRAIWEEDRLVITTVHTFEHPETGRPTPVEVKQTLSLASPDSLTVETLRAGVLGGQPSTVRTTYRKM